MAIGDSDSYYYFTDSYPYKSQWVMSRGSGEVEDKKPMKLTSLMKRLLDKDTQTLVKAGYLDTDLDLTNKGQEALLSLLLMANKPELVKMAQEELDEQKENKK